MKISTILLLATLLGSSAAQREYLNPATEAWTTVGGEVKPGNGLFADPSGDTLVGSFFDGSLIMFNAETGEKLATYTPSVSSGATIRGFGGVTFSYAGATPYVTYAITVNPFDDAKTRVIAVSPSGDQILETVGVPGVQSGTPLTTYDGRYILMNSNLDDQGYFSVFDTNGDTSNPIEPVYQFTGNSTAPFAPLGGFLQPAEGYYDGGEANRNDIFAWGVSVPENATAAGMGQLYAFQMPMDGSAMKAFALGGEQAFQMSTAPVFGNKGRNLYLATTRAEERCWVGEAGFDRSRFNRGRTETIGLTRGSPQYISAAAPPSLGGDPEFPTVYGPGAAAEVWAATYNFSMYVAVPTTAVVTSKVQVSPDNVMVYYGTQDGFLVQADAASLTPVWSKTFGVSLEGEIALNKQGTMVYACDSSGVVKAYTVSTPDSTTTAPTATAAPTGPTIAPTITPQPTITPRPTTFAPTKAPAAAATDSPTKTPTRDDAPTGSQPSGGSVEPLENSSATRAMGVVVPLALLLGLLL
ncbi:hypothetical protein MPSEU_000350800 [Mayamaea pseudoterrestris]|nr:hypothetical protein MPSEU_000350800 [Mayamaea pseudoterrestris]